MKRRPHQDLYCTCEACREWDKVFFVKCSCLCGDCKTSFVKALEAVGYMPDELKPESSV
jgi:hypothetical protein